MSQSKVQRMHQQVAHALGDLSELFTSGVKLTFIARFPGNDEADVLIGDDHDVEELVALVRRRFATTDSTQAGAERGRA